MEMIAYFIGPGLPALVTGFLFGVAFVLTLTGRGADH